MNQSLWHVQVVADHWMLGIQWDYIMLCWTILSGTIDVTNILMFIPLVGSLYKFYIQMASGWDLEGLDVASVNLSTCHYCMIQFNWWGWGILSPQIKGCCHKCFRIQLLCLGHILCSTMITLEILREAIANASFIKTASCFPKIWSIIAGSRSFCGCAGLVDGEEFSMCIGRACARWCQCSLVLIPRSIVFYLNNQLLIIHHFTNPLPNLK